MFLDYNFQNQIYAYARRRCGEDFDEYCRKATEGAGIAVTKGVNIVPKRILVSGDRTIVFWEDGTKTIVKRADDETDSIYAAFTAAVAIKMFGSNSALKKMIEKKTVYQRIKKGEADYSDFSLPTEPSAKAFRELGKAIGRAWRGESE